MHTKALIIGSTVADVIINLDKLPGTAEDVHVLGQRTQLGGCAFNVSDVLRHAGVPHVLFSPVGSGIYGDFIRSELKARGIPRAIADQDEPNGCCYCFVEQGGERTFISHHGAEYKFKREFFDRIDPNLYSEAYVCGLEIEETEGQAIVDFLVANPQIQTYFAPGPRILKLRPERMHALFSLHPVLHLNEREAHQYTGLPVEQAALWLMSKTGQDVVVTLGERGAYCLGKDGHGEHVPADTVGVNDTIGAGDAHVGALIAFQMLGYPFVDAVRAANRVAGAVVASRGAQITKNQFDELGLM